MTFTYSAFRPHYKIMAARLIGQCKLATEENKTLCVQQAVQFQKCCLLCLSDFCMRFTWQVDIGARHYMIGIYRHHEDDVLEMLNILCLLWTPGLLSSESEASGQKRDLCKWCLSRQKCGIRAGVHARPRANTSWLALMLTETWLTVIFILTQHGAKALCQSPVIAHCWLELLLLAAGLQLCCQ